MDLKEIKASRNTEIIPDLVGYNNIIRDAWTPLWVRNSCRSYQEVEKDFKERNCDIQILPKAKKGESAIILGSGPSLDKALPFLKHWKGAIFCSTSQLAILEYHDIHPSYLFLIDADPAMIYLMEKSKFRDTVPLITHVQIPREALECWKNVYYYRMYDPSDDYTAKYLAMQYGLVNVEKGWRISSYVMNTGNVVNNMIAIGQVLGYSPLFLCGYDLGYPNGQYRFTNYEKINKDSIERLKKEIIVAGMNINNTHKQQPNMKPKEFTEVLGHYLDRYKLLSETLGKYEDVFKDEEVWLKIEDPGIPPNRPTLMSGNGITTDQLCIFYKYSTILMWGVGAAPIIDCSEGILREIPHVDIRDVIAEQGKGFILPKWQDIYRTAQKYLKYRKIYILKNELEVSSRNLSDVPEGRRTWFKIKFELYSKWGHKFTKSIKFIRKISAKINKLKHPLLFKYLFVGLLGGFVFSSSIPLFVATGILLLKEGSIRLIKAKKKKDSKAMVDAITIKSKYEVPSTSVPSTTAPIKVMK